MRKISVFFSFLMIVTCISRASVFGGESIAADKAAKLISNGEAVLLDVREKKELTEGMAEPAQSFPYSEVDDKSEKWKSFVKGLAKNKPVIVYCGIGLRAGRVASRLEKQGYKVFNLGGFKDWKSKNLPVRSCKKGIECE